MTKPSEVLTREQIEEAKVSLHAVIAMHNGFSNKWYEERWAKVDALCDLALSALDQQAAIPITESSSELVVGPFIESVDLSSPPVPDLDAAVIAEFAGSRLAESSGATMGSPKDQQQNSPAATIAQQSGSTSEGTANPYFAGAKAGSIPAGRAETQQAPGKAAEPPPVCTGSGYIADLRLSSGTEGICGICGYRVRCNANGQAMVHPYRLPPAPQSEGGQS